MKIVEHSFQMMTYDIELAGVVSNLSKNIVCNENAFDRGKEGLQAQALQDMTNDR
jgi:hypothetical protein